MSIAPDSDIKLHVNSSESFHRDRGSSVLHEVRIFIVVFLMARSLAIIELDLTYATTRHTNRDSTLNIFYHCINIGEAYVSPLRSYQEVQFADRYS